MPPTIERSDFTDLEEIVFNLRFGGFAVSAGAAVLAANLDAVCLTQSKYSKKVDGEGEQGYKFPKGGIKLGENVLAASLRELEEETGIDPTLAVDLQPLHGKALIKDERQSKTGQDKYVVMVGLILPEVLPEAVELRPQDPDSITALWVPRDEARKIFTRQADIHKQPERAANNHEILNRLESAFGLPATK